MQQSGFAGRTRQPTVPHHRKGIGEPPHSGGSHDRHHHEGWHRLLEWVDFDLARIDMTTEQQVARKQQAASPMRTNPHFCEFAPVPFASDVHEYKFDRITRSCTGRCTGIERAELILMGCF